MTADSPPDIESSEAGGKESSGRGCAFGCLAMFIFVTVLPAFPPVKLSLIAAGLNAPSEAVRSSAVKAAWKQGKAGQQILADAFPEADPWLRTQILIHLDEVQGTDVQKQGFPEPFLPLVPELLTDAATTDSRWVTQNLDRGLRLAAPPEAYGEALLKRLTTLPDNPSARAHGTEVAELAGGLPDEGRAIVLSRLDMIPSPLHRIRVLDALMAKRPQRFGPATAAAIRDAWPRWSRLDREHLLALGRRLGVNPPPLDELDRETSDAGPPKESMPAPADESAPKAMSPRAVPGDSGPPPPLELGLTQKQLRARIVRQMKELVHPEASRRMAAARSLTSKPWSVLMTMVGFGEVLKTAQRRGDVTLQLELCDALGRMNEMGYDGCPWRAQLETLAKSEDAALARAAAAALVRLDADASMSDQRKQAKREDEEAKTSGSDGSGAK